MTAELADWGRPDWMDRGACVGMNADLFFPPRGVHTADMAEAKAVCAGCPVEQTCRDYALRHHIKYGLWGGTTERERRAIRKQGLRSTWSA